MLLRMNAAFHNVLQPVLPRLIGLLHKWGPNAGPVSLLFPWYNTTSKVTYIQLLTNKL